MNLVRLWLVSAFALCVPAMWLVIGGGHGSHAVEAVLFGAAILGAAFILSWAAEVAQMDMSQALATAILALIAVLPEYAVDLYFAWRAADDPTYGHYAAANMTGANRLLVGFGWPVVFLVFAWRFKKRSLAIEPGHRTEISFLGLATLYSFILPFKHSISLMDTVIFLSIFAVYAWKIAHAEVHEPELVGPAKLIGRLSQKPRRTVTLAFFVIAALVIFNSAERFAEALVHAGKEAGLDEFLLVQWLAPLASEAPEFIIAILWTFRGDAAAGLGALISSKVNQWTLLIGTIPIAYSISLGRPGSLHLDVRQQHELLLTACQSLFAVAVLMNLRMVWWEALLLFVLFMAQLLFEHIRMPMAVVYIVLAVLIMIRERAQFAALFRRRAT